ARGIRFATGRAARTARRAPLGAGGAAAIRSGPATKPPFTTHRPESEDESKTCAATRFDEAAKSAARTARAADAGAPAPRRSGRRAWSQRPNHHAGQPVERALARNALTPEQYSAGQKYRHHWYHAGLADRLESIDLNRIFAIDPGAYAGMAKTESQLFHRQRYREAVQAVGKIGSHVMEWAVCREIALEQVGQTLGWSSRPQAYAAAVERLKTALDEL